MILTFGTWLLEAIYNFVGFLDNIIPSLIPFFLSLGNGFSVILLPIANIQYLKAVVIIICSVLLIGAFLLNFWIIKNEEEYEEKESLIKKIINQLRLKLSERKAQK